MLTVFNAYKNHALGREEWHKTVLSGARAGGGAASIWQGGIACQSGPNGQEEAHAALVIIWHSAYAQGKTYVPPEAFMRLEPEDVPRHWTLCPGRDFLVNGLVPDEAPENAPEPQTPHAAPNIEDLRAIHGGCITIQSVQNWANATEGLCHWEVSGL